MLKHIKDIRSPIAVAQQKQAARKASNASSANPNASTTSTSSNARSGAQGHGRTLSRPPRLQVHAAQGATEPPLNTGGSAATGWPELMSPAGGDSRPGLHTSNSNLSLNDSAPKSAVAPVTASSAGGGDGHGREGGGHGGKEREQPVGGENVSYSVAIYPYMAEQEDEFDVVVYVSSLLPLLQSLQLTCSQWRYIRDHLESTRMVGRSARSPRHGDGR